MTVAEIEARLAAKDRRYAALFARRDGRGLPAEASAAAECAHRGDPLPGFARQAAGLDHRKAWYRCDHPDRASLVAESARRGLVIGANHRDGKAVCPCIGCGPRCPGYDGGDP